jgi:hypothetical protein
LVFNKPNAEVIADLEKMLEQAKKGELQALVAICLNGARQAYRVETDFYPTDSKELIYELIAAQHIIVAAVEASRVADFEDLED